MIMCSVCKKNVAVIFTTKIENGKKVNMGLCIPCAKKMGISPIDGIIDNSEISEDDFSNVNKQMSEMLDSLKAQPSDDENNPFLSMISNAFSGNESFDEEIHSTNGPKVKETSNKKERKRKFLDTYGINLTRRAKEGKVDKVVGRNREIDRVIQILNRRSKNNPILIGEAGVGKTAIAEGLAVRIKEKEVPLKLINTEVYLLELTSIVAGTQFRGQFESRMKGIIDEAKEDGHIILIIDEIHNIIGAGSAENGAMNAANILKPSLARGEVQIIGATTLEEYRKNIEKDSALARRFQPVLVDEPSIEDSIEILKGIKGYYENYHKVIIPDEILEYAVKLSERYINDRFLPDKAIDVIDEAGSRANLKNQGLVELEALKDELNKVTEDKNTAEGNNDFEHAAEYKAEICRIEEKIKTFEEKYEDVIITEEDVAYVIQAWTKIPVQKITEIEAEKLLNLEDSLHKRVIGQNKAVTSLSRAIRRNRSGFKKFVKPASFIFVGPTGVGKTELARALSTELFGSEKNLIRVDMSEYMEKHTVSKLIGAPPGYIGYDEGGQLTEKVRRNPYSVILLDEIEKAHPDVFNLLLQILEDGRLTDNQGRTVHFENTVLIMTSNAGTNTKGNGIGFSKDDYASLVGKINEALKETFRPEFLNRVDEVVVFTELTKEEQKNITHLMIREIQREALEKNITLNVDDNIYEFLIEKGYSQKYGARPLRRVIQRYVEDELAEMYLKGTLLEGDFVFATLKDDKILMEKKR